MYPGLERGYYSRCHNQLIGTPPSPYKGAIHSLPPSSSREFLLIQGSVPVLHIPVFVTFYCDKLLYYEDSPTVFADLRKDSL